MLFIKTTNDIIYIVRISQTSFKGEIMFGKLPLSTFVITKIAANTVAAGKAIFRVPFACTIKAMSVATDIAPTGASLIFDIHKNGTTLFTTQANRPTIVASAVSASVALPAVTTLAAGDVLTVDCDQIGSSVASTGFTIAIAVLPTGLKGYY